MRGPVDLFLRNPGVPQRRTKVFVSGIVAHHEQRNAALHEMRNTRVFDNMGAGFTFRDTSFHGGVVDDVVSLLPGKMAFLPKEQGF